MCQAAIVVEKSSAKGGGDNVRVGLADGRVFALSAPKSPVLRTLKLYDVVLVRIIETKGKGTRAELQVRPTVEDFGAAIRSIAAGTWTSCRDDPVRIVALCTSRALTSTTSSPRASRIS